MKFHKNKLLTTGAAVALALAVGACSSSSDDDEMAGTPPTPPVMDGDGDADAMNGDDDTKTPVERLDEARDALAALPADATDDARAEAMTALVAALMLAGNEDAYVTYLEEKVADQEAAAAATAAAAAAEEASDMAKAVIMAIKDNTGLPDNPPAPDTAHCCGETGGIICW